MANSRAEVVLEFIGDDSRLSRTLASVESKTGSMLGVIGKLGKVGAGAFAFTTMANTAATAASALITLAPAALALPGIFAGVRVASVTAALALDGFADAVGGDAKALAKLAPAARASAQEVIKLKTGFEAVKAQVQQSAFKDLAPQIAETGKQLLTIASQHLPKVASGLNGMARSALAAARNPLFQGALAAVIDHTAMALGNARDVAGNLLRGLMGLAPIGSQYLPNIAMWIDKIAAGFNQWVQTGIKNGSIQRFVDGALAGFRQLGDLLIQVGAVVAAIFTGLGKGMGTAATPLGILVEKVKALNIALSQPEAQAALAKVGEAIRAISDAFTAVLPYVIQFAAIIVSAVLPAVIGLAGFIQANAGVFGALVAGLIAFNVAASIFSAIVGVVRGAIMAWTAVQWLLNFALSANPIGIIIVLIAALVAGLIYAWNNSETFRNIVIGAWEAIKTAIGAAVDFIVAGVTGFINLLIAQWHTFEAANAALWAAVGNVIQGAVDFIIGLWNNVASFFTGIPGRIGQALGSIGSIIGGIFKGALNTAIGWVNWGIDRINSLINGINMVGGFVGLRIPNIPHVPSFHTGGIVPGTRGSEMLAMVQAGEMVIPADVTRGLMAGGAASGSGSGSGGTVVSFTGNTSDALATVIMGMIRTGKIQIKAA